jgi:acetoacetyl-CoA synthetase
VFPFVRNAPCLPEPVGSLSGKGMSLEEFLGPDATDVPATDLLYEQLPFDQPLVILFSSGTTGKPKCIVHGAGRMLLQHLKEHVLHGDLRQDDVFFYYTTTSWMMWNWMTSALGVGATVVLYDGSPFKPSPHVLWELVDRLGITVFGTSAKYLQTLHEGGILPGKAFQLTTLRSIFSTGSPLAPATFDYVYRDIKADIVLGSITGGTDIASLFAGHNQGMCLAV